MNLQLNLDIHREMMIVNFAGGGGSCTGIEMATGRLKSLLRDALPHVAASAEATTLKSELAHWKSNHATVVTQARILKERTDMPIERVKAYEKWQETEAKCIALAAQNQEMRDSIANLLRNKHADECWLILSVDCIRLEELLKTTNQGTAK